jgi:hypothetical protein
MSYGLTPPIPPPPSNLLSVHFAYIVAFRLNGPPTAYKDFYSELQNYDAWLNYIPNFWIVMTRMPMVTVAASLRSKIRTTDWLMVMPAKGPIDGWLPESAWDWASKHLKREW